MEMKKFEEMKLVVSGDPEQDLALLEWLYLAILAPLSLGTTPKVRRRKV